MSRFSDEHEDCEVPAPVAEWCRRAARRGALSGPQYERVRYGLYRTTGARLTTAQRIVDVAVGLPTGALIAGWAAAYVDGVDLLDGLDDFTMAALPVPVLLPPGQRRRSRVDVAYRQSTRLSRGP